MFGLNQKHKNNKNEYNHREHRGLIIFALLFSVYSVVNIPEGGL